MSEPVEIYVPCDVFDARVRVGPADASSPLEVLVMKATHEGVTSVDALADLFGLGPRLTLDLVFDLWRQGHVVIDLAAGKLHLSERAARAAAVDALETLALAQATEETWQVMQERLTGFVLPAEGPRAPKQQRAAVPTGGLDTGINDIGRDDLYRALRRIAEHGQNGQRGVRVLGAHVGGMQRAEAASRRWLVLHVRATLDPDDGRPLVEVLDEGRFPHGVRTRMAAVLTRLVEDQPDDRFARHVLEGAERALLRPFDVNEALDAMGAAIDELIADDGARDQREEAVLAIDDAIEDWSASRLSDGLAADVIVGLDAHVAAVKRLIRAARRQVVIVCPWVRSRAMNDLLDDLHAALARGAQVFLLWGINADAVLDRDVLNAFRQLRAEFPHTFFASDRSSRTHAKLVVQDDRTALITSCNVLSASRKTTFEVGVVLRAAALARCQPIEQLLTWAHGQYPEYLTSQSMYALADDFRTRSDAEADPLGESLPRVPRRPESVAGYLEQPLLRAWQAAWRRRYAALEGAVRRTRAESAEILRDGEHRSALQSAMREARTRLIIASDQLGPEVVEDRFLANLEDVIARGAHVMIVHQRASQHLALAGHDPMQRLRELAAAHPNQLTYIDDADSHAKVIVADDWAVIASFNFLSFEGLYAGGAGAARRSRSEVGVRLEGQDRVDAVVRAFAAQFPGAPPETASAVPQDVAPSAQVPLVAAADEVSDLLQALASSDDPVELLAGRLPSATRPWQVLDALTELGLPEELLRVAAATCITQARAIDPQAATRWLGWLAEHMWQEGRYVECALLCGGVPHLPSKVVPARELVTLVAARGTLSFGDAAEEAALAELAVSERLGLAALCIAELVLRGDPTAAAVATDERTSLPAAWQSLLDAASRHWNTTFEPLPISDITRELDEGEHRAFVDQCWSDLEEVLQEGAGRNFGFASGKKTGSYLYRPDGPMGRLTEIAMRRDAAAVGDWLRSEQPRDLNEWLDDATRAATGRTDQMFHSGIRASYVGILGRIFGAAHRVVDAIGTAEEAHLGFRIQHAEEFASELRRLWPNLEVDTHELPPASRQLAGLVLEELAPIRQWRAP